MPTDATRPVEPGEPTQPGAGAGGGMRGSGTRAAAVAALRRALDLDLLPEQTRDDRPTGADRPAEDPAASGPASGAEPDLRRLRAEVPPHHVDRPAD